MLCLTLSISSQSAESAAHGSSDKRFLLSLNVDSYDHPPLLDGNPHPLVDMQVSRSRNVHREPHPQIIAPLLQIKNGFCL